MKLLHTADVHLGRPFSGLGRKGQELRDTQLKTLGRMVETAASEKADCIVVAGDLFDSNEVSGGLVRKVVRVFSEIDQVPVLVLPGTHDLLDDTSVYLRKEFEESPNVYIFGLDGDSFEIDGATVTGYPNDSKQGGIRPLKKLKPDPGTDVNVAVVHASVAIKGKHSPDDYLVNLEDISRSGFTYVALGHWHRRGDYSSGGTAAWYPGAPEPLKFDEGDGAGDILLVDIDTKKVNVEPRHMGTFSWLEKTYDVSKYPPGGPLESELKKLADTEALLRLHLRGVAPKGVRVDPAVIEADLEGEFFHLEVEASRVGYPVNDLERFPSGTVGALFVQDMKKRIRSTRNPEQKALLEEALYRGAGYLAGDMEVN